MYFLLSATIFLNGIICPFMFTSVSPIEHIAFTSLFVSDPDVVTLAWLRFVSHFNIRAALKPQNKLGEYSIITKIK